MTYKDFKIGQIVTCYYYPSKYNSDSDYDNSIWDDKLTYLKKYTITDADFHFPDKIAITGDNKRGFFVPIRFFIPNIEEVRNERIEEIGIKN